MNKLESIRQKINKLQEEEKLLTKQELEKQKDNFDWLNIGQYQISKQFFNGLTYKECQDKAKELGYEIASYELIQKLRNQNIDKRFINFWVFVPNPDKINENNNCVAWFCAYSDWACLNCDGGPTGTNSGLGVFLIRKKIKVKE